MIKKIINKIKFWCRCQSSCTNTEVKQEPDPEPEKNDECIHRKYCVNI